MQYSNMKANEMLSVTSQRSTANMELLARKTTRETASMHVITLITLLFLPAMFLAVRMLTPALSLPASCGRGRNVEDLEVCHLTGLASSQTLFESPLFDWKKPVNESLRLDIFFLFAKVCFPMMAITVCICGLAYWWARRHAERRVEDIHRTFEQESFVENA